MRFIAWWQAQGRDETELTRLYRAEELVKPALALVLMTMLVVTSSLLVIVSAHDYRKYFHQHQVLVRQHDDLQVEWGQLLLEQGTWAANNRVESLAVKKLDMKVPEQETIEFVRHD